MIVNAYDPKWIDFKKCKPKFDEQNWLCVKIQLNEYEYKNIEKGAIFTETKYIECFGILKEDGQHEIWGYDNVDGGENDPFGDVLYYDFPFIWENDKISEVASDGKKTIVAFDLEIVAWFPLPYDYE